MCTPLTRADATTKRESGHEAQQGNIRAAKAVADVVRTCLGPKAMLKMILSQTGQIVLTNDGNAILREVNVQHPAARAMIDLARTQDESVGDGTTSVTILGTPPCPRCLLTLQLARFCLSLSRGCSAKCTHASSFPATREPYATHWNTLRLWLVRLTPQTIRRSSTCFKALLAQVRCLPSVPPHTEPHTL